MARVLFVGQQPETVDFTNPVLPPCMNAERIHAGHPGREARGRTRMATRTCACFGPVKRPDSPWHGGSRPKLTTVW